MTRCASIFKLVYIYIYIYIYILFFSRGLSESVSTSVTSTFGYGARKTAKYPHETTSNKIRTDATL